MAVCGKCGAPVKVAKTVDGDVKGFDVHEVTHGPGRYVQTSGGFSPCRESYAEPAYQDHEMTCAARHRAP